MLGTQFYMEISQKSGRHVVARQGAPCALARRSGRSEVLWTSTKGMVKIVSLEFCAPYFAATPNARRAITTSSSVSIQLVVWG